MNRLKFRAWDKVNKKWLLGYDYPNLGGFSLVGETVIMGEFSSLFRPLSRINEIEITQFIGLKDKKGKEIYEGDILKLDSWEGTQQVRFIEGAFCLAFKDGEFAGDIHYIHHAGIEQATVIGNIFENSELLS